MLFLLRSISLRYYRGNRIRSFITLLGVTLGVAVLAAIRITNHSTLSAFQNTVEAISGRARLQITADGSGFDERLLVTVRRQPGVDASAPLVQARLLVADAPGEMLLVAGIDLLSDRAVREYVVKDRDASSQTSGADPLELLTHPDAIILSERFAHRYGINVGSPIELFTPMGKRRFVVKALLGFKGPARTLSGNFALLDIAAAQVQFGKLGKLDRIDVTVKAGHDLDAVQTRLQKALGEGVRVERPASRNKSVERMLRSFHVNLFALSLIALFVGMFLIYNTISFAVMQRRKEIGILRSLGLTQRSVAALFLTEAFILGFIGSALGLLLGIVLAKAAMHLVSGTVSALFILVSIEHLTVTPGTIILSLLIGTLCSPLAALMPIKSATLVPPTAALQRFGLEQRPRAAIRMYSLAGLVCLLLAALLSQFEAVGGVPLFGYLASFVTVLGAALLAPLATTMLTRNLLPATQRLFRIEGRLATDNLQSSLGRTSVAIAALMTGVAMVVSMGIMVHSFKQTVFVWVDQTVRADLVISQAAPVSSAMNVKMPASLAREVEEVEGVAEVDAFKGLNVNYRGALVFLAVGELDVFGRYSKFVYLEGEKNTALRQVIDEGAVFISENLSAKTGLHRGDALRLSTPSGPVDFRVAAVLVDYSADRGTVTMHRPTFLKYWRDDLIDTMGVFLEPGYVPEQVARAITRRFADRYSLFVLTNRAFKDEVIKLVNQTFHITNALELIAIFVALLGILNALFASILERTREIGILRSIGALTTQIKRIVMVEAALMGCVAEFVGFITGIILALILIHVINKQSFGWTIQMSYPVPLLVGSTLLIFLTACLAGYFPARRAAATDLKEALHYE